MKARFLLLMLVFVVVILPAQEKGKLSVKSSGEAAHVYVDSVSLGITPVDSIPIDTGKHVLRCISLNERSWYQPPVIETVMVVAGAHLEKIVTIPALNAKTFAGSVVFSPNDIDPSLNKIPEKALAGRTVGNNTPIYLTTAGAVLGGALAAYFKLQADNNYDEYQNTGSLDALNKVKRNDTISGVALGVCEINLALLTYLLLSR